MSEPAARLVPRDAQRHAHVCDVLERRLEKTRADPTVVEVFGFVVREDGDWTEFYSGGMRVTEWVGKMEAVKTEMLLKYIGQSGPVPEDDAS